MLSPGTGRLSITGSPRGTTSRTSSTKIAWFVSPNWTKLCTLRCVVGWHLGGLVLVGFLIVGTELAQASLVPTMSITTRFFMTFRTLRLRSE